MKTKICTKCKKRKNLKLFTKAKRGLFGRRSDCNECKRIRQNKWAKKTSYRSKYYQKNKEKCDTASRNWKLNNIERFREYDRQKHRDPKNRIVINAAKRKYYHKRKKEPIYQLIYRVRNRTKSFFREVQFMKKVNFPEYIGCSPEELFKHIEDQFTAGMTWEKFTQAEIHIDHIIPISRAKTKKQVYKLSHYTNLQPLWVKDHQNKTNKEKIKKHNNVKYR